MRSVFFQNFIKKHPIYAVVLIWLLLIALVNPFGDFPLNDDWKYAYPVKTLIQKGVFEMLGIFAPNLVLQVGWGYLFCLIFKGFSFTYLRFSTLFLAITGASIAFKTTKELTQSRQAAFFNALALSFSPLYFCLSFSFMTDVPFLAFCLLAIWQFQKYLKTGAEKQLFFTALWSIGAFLIRQPGILLLAALIVFVFFEKRLMARKLQTAFWLAILLLLAWFGFEKGVKPWMGISENYVPVSSLFVNKLVEQPFEFFLAIFRILVKTVIYLGLFSLPFFPFLFSKCRKLGMLKWKIQLPVFVLNFVLLLFLIKIGKVFPFGGNILFNFGLGPELLADVFIHQLPNTPHLPAWTMLSANFTGQIAGSWLLIFVGKTFHALPVKTQKFFFFLFLVNALYLPLMSITSFFDRYLLLPLVSLFLFLAWQVPTESWRKNWASFLPLFLMAWFSFAGTKDYLNWNRSRLEAFHYLQSKQLSIKDIDAGYEYNGWYNYQAGFKQKEGKSYWWVEGDSYAITLGQLPGFEPVQSFSFYRYLIFKKDEIWIVKRKE